MANDIECYGMMLAVYKDNTNIIILRASGLQEYFKGRAKVRGDRKGVLWCEVGAISHHNFFHLPTSLTLNFFFS